MNSFLKDFQKITVELYLTGSFTETCIRVRGVRENNTFQKKLCVLHINTKSQSNGKNMPYGINYKRIAFVS